MAENSPPPSPTFLDKMKAFDTDNDGQLTSEELSAGIIQIKDLKLGSELSKEIATNQEWKDRRAQIKVKREDMVVAVKKILGWGSG